MSLLISHAFNEYFDRFSKFHPAKVRERTGLIRATAVHISCTVFVVVVVGSQIGQSYPLVWLIQIQWMSLVEDS